MIQILIRLVIAVVVVFCIRLLLPMLGLPNPFETVALVIIALIAFLYVIGYIPTTDINIKA